jgi:hypothetical protein
MEPVSRTQLCQATGLANATVSDVVRDLLNNGFLQEEREVASGRGRPRILLKTDPIACWLPPHFCMWRTTDWKPAFPIFWAKSFASITFISPRIWPWHAG